MLRCELCENEQEGGEVCTVCDRPFAPPAVPPALVEPVEGLEPTLAGAVEAPVERVEELEPNQAAAVEVMAERVEDLLPTALEGLPDGEGAGARGAPATAPAPLACRYCGLAAGSGLFCEGCGMKLPVARAPAPAGEGDEPRRCRNCAVPVHGASCPACGTRVLV